MIAVRHLSPWNKGLAIYSLGELLQGVINSRCGGFTDHCIDSQLGIRSWYSPVLILASGMCE